MENGTASGVTVTGEGRLQVRGVDDAVIEIEERGHDHVAISVSTEPKTVRVTTVISRKGARELGAALLAATGVQVDVDGALEGRML